MILLHVAQMPYEPMVACFDSSTSGAREDRTATRALMTEMFSFLRERDFVSEDCKWQGSERFVQSVAACGDLPRLRTAIEIWPNAAWNERGQALLEFLAYMNQDGIDLGPNADLQNSPPPRWREFVDEFIKFRDLRANDEVKERGEE
jgi:hypothetical protein